MKKQNILFAAGLLFALSACDMKQETSKNQEKDNAKMMEAESKANENDHMITQKLREALMKDPNLSKQAKNIKIVTAEGVILIKGTINNENDKNAVGQKAKTIPGVKNVDNMLEIIEVEEVGKKQEK